MIMRFPKDEVVDWLVRFLRKPRWESTNIEYVDNSIFIWGPKVLLGEDADKYDGWRLSDIPDDTWTLSLLGIINGVLPKLIKRRLAVQYNDDNTTKKFVLLKRNELRRN